MKYRATVWRYPSSDGVVRLVANHTGLTTQQAIARLAGHVFAGSVMFFLIAVPAVGLHVLIQSVPWPRNSEYIVAGLALLEYAIFGIDALIFLAYLIVSAYRFVKEL